MHRREFLMSVVPLAPLQEPGADPLRRPDVAGRWRLPVESLDNDPTIKAIERKLKCTCGCNLDIYTCRTTDFTCTYSPQLHAEIVELYRSGLSPDQVVEAFVERHGVQALMAPPARGFNLMGYLVPGAAVLVAAAALVLVLLRRHRAAAVAAPLAVVNAAEGHATLSPEELERLERALEEVAD
jgi:cytochrome c-type biogenesis protein CcmH